MLSMLLFNKVAPCKGVRIPESGKFFFWNPDAGKFILLPWILGLESGIQLKESEISPTINGIRNLGSTYKVRPESRTWNLRSTARNPESKTVLDSFTWGERFHVRTAMWLTLFIYLFIHLFHLFKFNKQLFSNTVTFLTKVGLFLPSTRSYVLSISLFERSSPKGTSTFPRTLRNEGGKCCVL